MTRLLVLVACYNNTAVFCSRTLQVHLGRSRFCPLAELLEAHGWGSQRGVRYLAIHAHFGPSARTVILPRDSTPGSAPSVGGSQVGPAEVVGLGVSSPGPAADAGPPSPSGRPTTSVDDGDDDGDDEDNGEFKTVPNLGPLLADQAAARRESVSTRDDFLPPRIRELVGDTEMVVRFDDDGTEVLLTENRPATKSRPGCRAGWTIQLGRGSEY
eukprot:COSAG06_NODE_416_length_15996_cov_260.778637_16_plen_213_part_00